MSSPEDFRGSAISAEAGLLRSSVASILERFSSSRLALPTGYNAVRIALGLLLLTAAALKGYELATEPVAETSLLTSRWFLIALVEFELFLGLWLLMGAYPQRTRLAAIVFFGALAAVSLYKGLSGEASCGCFGKVAVSPWYTFALDFVAVAALLVWRPSRSMLTVHSHDTAKPYSASLRHAVVASRFQLLTAPLLFLFVGIPVAIPMVGYSAATIAEDGMITGEGNIIVLKPEKWVGSRFPLLAYIDIGEQLADGNWIIVIYQPGCANCQSVIRKYEALARGLSKDSAGPRVALLEISPYNGRAAVSVSSCVVGRLSDSHEWFLATASAVLELRSGSVLQIIEGAPLDETRYVGSQQY